MPHYASPDTQTRNTRTLQPFEDSDPTGLKVHITCWRCKSDLVCCCHAVGYRYYAGYPALRVHVVYSSTPCACGVLRHSVCMWCTPALCIIVVYSSTLCACGVLQHSVCMWCTPALCMHVVYSSTLYACGVLQHSVCMWCIPALCIIVVYSSTLCACDVFQHSVCM